jgi:WhiB family redox-sensing transcriptional regulator
VPLLSLVSDVSIDKPAWQASSACREHPEVDFFVDRAEDAEAAKSVCARCPVRRECLEHALANDERHGIWGGLSPRQRKALVRRASRQPLSEERAS